MNSPTQSYILLLFGAAMLRIGSGDVLLRYVRPVARPWIMTGAALVVMLAVGTLVVTVRNTRREDDAPGSHTSGGHRHGATKLAWLILAPVVTLLFVEPSALGAYSTSRVPAAITRPGVTDFPELPSGVSHLSMIDFAVRAASNNGASLRGHEVELLGFVSKRRTDGFELARLVITCCAADAFPIVVDVTGVAAPVGINGWVLVDGMFTGNSTAQRYVPTLRAVSAIETAAPANPYG